MAETMRASIVLAFTCLLLAATAAPAAEPATGLRGKVMDLFETLRGHPLPAGIVKANGRIEAGQILISAKLAGRVAAVLADEGDTVAAGAVLAHMDVSDLEAERAGAEAQVRRAETAIAQVEASIAQRDSELALARQEFDRAQQLNTTGHGTAQQLDLKKSALDVAIAVRKAADASLAEAKAAADAARADLARVEAEIADATLTAPKRGRIEYKLVQAGEVVGAGSPILTLLDLADITMTIFLPARDAGRLAIGDEARIILDPAPDYVVPATVAFVAADAQFTPKTVETSDEREKLMFRVKLRIAPELLRAYEDRVKAGVRGVAYVRTDPAAAWPAELAVKLPQ